MVVISLYRGKLHSVPTVPRRWPMPSRAISLHDFKRLNRRRSTALAVLIQATSKPISSRERNISEDGTGDEKDEDGVRKNLPSDPFPMDSGSLGQGRLETGIPNDSPGKLDGDIESSRDPNGLKAFTSSISTEGRADSLFSAPVTEAAEPPSADVKLVVSNSMKLPGDKDEKKKELASKLKVLNEKKHHLVQMLKQILNAEEEVKRRTVQLSDTASAPRPAPSRLSVDVGCGGDLGEPDASTTNSSNTYFRQFPLSASSPSGASPLGRSTNGPFHQTPILPTARGSTTIVTAASPPRFNEGVHQGHRSWSSPASSKGS